MKVIIIFTGQTADDDGLRRQLALSLVRQALGAGGIPDQRRYIIESEVGSATLVTSGM